VTPPRAPRFRLEESVAASCRINGHQRRSVGVTRDISTTGLFYYAHFRPDEGTRLELILTLPAEVTHAETLPAVCVGRVVRVEPNDMAGRVGVAVEIERWQTLSAA
jgi:PilZ domain-containing protein